MNTYVVALRYTVVLILCNTALAGTEITSGPVKRRSATRRESGIQDRMRQGYLFVQHPITPNRCKNNIVDFGKDDGQVNFAQMHNAGVNCVLHHFPEDNNYVIRAKLAVRSKGTAWGAYLNGYQGDRSRAHAKQCAERLLQQLKRTEIENKSRDRAMLIVLDSEGNHRMTLAQCAEFARVVHHITGVYPGLYVNYRELDSDCLGKGKSALSEVSVRDLETLRQCWLWVSTYGPVSHMTFSIPIIWSDWTMWQYCGDDSGTFNTALQGASYSGRADFFNRLIPFRVRATGERSNHVADRDLFNGGERKWAGFLSNYTTAPRTWRF